MLSQTISKLVLNLRAAFILSAKNGVLGLIKWTHTMTRKAFQVVTDLHREDKAFSCFLFLKAKWTLLILLVIIWQCHAEITELALNQLTGLGQDCNHARRGLCWGCYLHCAPRRGANMAKLLPRTKVTCSKLLQTSLQIIAPHYVNIT